LLDKVREVEEHAPCATRADMAALTAEVAATCAEVADPDLAIRRSTQASQSCSSGKQSDSGA
jgi:hypothetical protein